MARPKPTPVPLNEILRERGSTHGNFVDNSENSQKIKDTMRAGPNWSKLTFSQREALDMIAHKIGRILSGDPDYLDHWTDLQGYPKLVADQLKK